MVHGVLNNVLLEHGGLPFIFPFKVHLDFEHSVVLEAFMVKYTVFFPVLLKVSLIMFYLNMVDYLMSSLLPCCPPDLFT